MRVLILGAGGVGGYIGAQLIRHTDAEVSMVARGSHLQAIREQDLEIREDEENYTVRPAHAVADPSDLGTFDLILVTVKATDLDVSLERIRNNVKVRTVLLPLLNGVDHDRKLRSVFPDARILNGCIYILSNIVEPGVIRKRGSIFQICWGRRDFDPEDFRDLSELFNRAKLHHKATERIDHKVWKKFLFISPMAALTSLYRIPMDRVVLEHRQELEGMMGELLGLARKREIPLDRDDLERTLERMAKTLPGAKTSMQLDLEKGKPAEIENLVGHPVREGKRLGIPTPFYSKVYDALKTMYA